MLLDICIDKIRSSRKTFLGIFIAAFIALYIFLGLNNVQSLLSIKPFNYEYWIRKMPSVAFIIAINDEDYNDINIWDIAQQARNGETSLSIDVIFRNKSKLGMDVIGLGDNSIQYSHIFFLNDFHKLLTLKLDKWFEIIKTFVRNNDGKQILGLSPPPYFTKIEKFGSFVLSQALPMVALNNFFGAETRLYRKVSSSLVECMSDDGDFQFCLNTILLSYKENQTLQLDSSFYQYYENKISKTGLKLAAANSERRSNSVDKLVNNIQHNYLKPISKQIKQGINQSSTLKVN